VNAVCGLASGQPGGLADAAADVEHAVFLADRGGCEQCVVEAAVHRVIAIGVLSPVFSFPAVPCLCLLGVRDRGHRCLHFH
jgi:hypothetical protein